MTSHWDWLQPRPPSATEPAMTFGRMMNMPNSGAVLMRRVRKPIAMRLFVKVRRTPERITREADSSAGARRREPCSSRTPNQARRKPASTRTVEASIAPVCPA